MCNPCVGGSLATGQGGGIPRLAISSIPGPSTISEGKETHRDAELSRVHEFLIEFADRLQEIGASPQEVVQTFSLSPRKHSSSFGRSGRSRPPIDIDAAIVRCEACISPIAEALHQLQDLKQRTESSPGTPSRQCSAPASPTAASTAEAKMKQQEDEAQQLLDELETAQATFQKMGSRLHAVVATVASMVGTDPPAQSLKFNIGPLDICEGAVSALEGIVPQIQKRMQHVEQEAATEAASQAAAKVVELKHQLEELQERQVEAAARRSEELEQQQLLERSEVACLKQQLEDMREAQKGRFRVSTSEPDLLKDRCDSAQSEDFGLSEAQLTSFADDGGQSPSSATAATGWQEASFEAAESTGTFNTGTFNSGRADKVCEICGSKMGKRHLKPRHHCRSCNRAVCGECARSSVRLPGGKETVRVCNTCVQNAFAKEGE